MNETECVNELRNMNNTIEIDMGCLEFIGIKKHIMHNIKKIVSKKIILIQGENDKNRKIEKQDPYEIIKDRDKLNDFFRKSNNQFFLKIVYSSEYIWHLTHGISIKNQYAEEYSRLNNDSELKRMLHYDIELVNNNNILTSRLAIITYRIANLDLFASTTNIGRYFHEQVGSKSKAFSSKLYPNITNKYSFRAYDLTINETEKEIVKKIAKKMLSLKIKKLNNKIISDVTGLSIKDLNKL